ncbi:ROK family protein [Pararhizobium antarcticum]|uniref:Transcriptional regulator n=1 Tax=Pararhizobium antarcticum TaxID=1798805 RepID=A0A657M0C9_9HYPH|nr:ROK family protein [Pararhizobium antarcticum]OJF89798.1 transcriptional regulator [Rhizobium sp. 58]OJF99747.1 transcriptional regulator [Pararhizobium antarcticum]
MPDIAVGIDIGGTNIRAALISRQGDILRKVSEQTPTEPRHVIERIREMVSRLDPPAQAGVGVGVPGRVDVAGRAVLSGGILNLAGLDFVPELERVLGRPVTVENDCSMALIAEIHRGAAKGYRSVAMLTIGTGIGGAVAQDGRIHHGRMTAGQLGHLSVAQDGPVCACGRKGCVETFSSGTALRRHMREAGMGAPSIDEVFALADGGDAAARSVLQAWAAPLRLAVDSLAATIDPELIVLGGGLGAAAARALAGLPAPAPWFQPKVVAADLGDDAGVIGAGLSTFPSAASLSGKNVVLVNGVPASGKSRLAQRLSQQTGWPILSLDGIKNPFLQHIGTVDRDFNRTLGKASYQAIWSFIRDAPPNSSFIVDAWFGFQPKSVLEGYIGDAGVDHTAELWCKVPGQVAGERYASRLKDRLPGHPGAEYVSELVTLADRAEPIGVGPVMTIDQTLEPDMPCIMAWISGIFGRA